MNTLDTEFHRRLSKLLAEQREQRSQSVLTGAMDFPEYRRQCGYLKGLQDVADWCEEIETNMRQGK